MCTIFEVTGTQRHASIEGISSVNTETYHIVSLHLRSRHTDWHTTLNCTILFHITGTTTSTKLDTSTWKIPKDIKLADEQFDQPGGIELLIGPDLYYEMLRSGWMTRPGNYPVLQETVLGSTLSGRTPATTTQHDPQPAFLLREDNSLEQNLNRSWEVEPMEPSTMTTEEHTQPNKMMEDLLTDCQQRWIPSNLDILASLQSEDYIYLNADLNKN